MTNRVLTYVAVSVAAILLALQLLIPPILGLANEGDFERVMGYAGVNYLTDRFDEKYRGHIVTKFAIVEPGWYRSGYLTSEVPLAWLAREASVILRPGRPFDLRFLGGVHILLLLIALGLLLSSCRDLSVVSQCLAASLLVFVFADVGYAAALNSFYAQTASLLFMLLTLGCAAVAIRSGGLRGRLVVAYFLCAALFVCSKPQEAVLGPLLAAWGIWLARSPRERWWRGPVVWLAAGLCAFSFWYYRQIPKTDIRYVGLFHTVFHDLLQTSPDPGRDMDELGIDRGLARYIGMHAYMPGAPIHDPDFQRRFFDRLTYGKLTAFYLSHPDRFLDRLRRAAPAAFRLRPKYLGNFEKSTGVPPRTKATRFALWSDLRATLEHRAILWLSLFFGGNLVAVAIAWVRASRRTRLFLSGVLVCLVLAAREFVVCTLADSLDDLGRHLFVFDAVFDLVLIADVVWLTQALSRRLAARRSAATAPA